MNISYPFRINNYKRTAVADQEFYIHQLIEQVLFTNPGERVNRPNFGGGIQQLIFAPGSDELITANEFLVKSALQQWLGDLITVESLQIEAQEEKLFIGVQYVIRKSQQRRVDQFIAPVS